MTKSEIYFEEVTDRIGKHILASKIRLATTKEIREAHAVYKKTGLCNHNIVQDDCGWMYDFRGCVVCGKGLGAI